MVATRGLKLEFPLSVDASKCRASRGLILLFSSLFVTSLFLKDKEL
jgi:hypothetical protein